MARGLGRSGEFIQIIIISVRTLIRINKGIHTGTLLLES
jgi:hypothetical protein